MPPKIIKQAAISVLFAFALLSKPEASKAATIARSIPCKYVTLTRTIKARYTLPEGAPEAATKCILWLNKLVRVTDGSVWPGFVVDLFNDANEVVGHITVTNEIDNTGEAATYWHFTK